MAQERARGRGQHRQHAQPLLRRETGTSGERRDDRRMIGGEEGEQIGRYGPAGESAGDFAPRGGVKTLAMGA